MQYLKWLDKISYSTLIVATILLGLAPFVPMPHSIEKILLLKDGDLTKPIDIFDLFYHFSPVILIALKYSRIVKRNLSMKKVIKRILNL
jgi:hypothetical protein